MQAVQMIQKWQRGTGCCTGCFSLAKGQWVVVMATGKVGKIVSTSFTGKVRLLDSESMEYMDPIHDDNKPGQFDM